MQVLKQILLHYAKFSQVPTLNLHDMSDEDSSVVEGE